MIQTKFNCTSEVFELKTKLQNNGIIFFEKIINEEEFCNFCENFGNIYYHRDSNQNGITIVKNCSENKDGFIGLTSNSLFPHTDRSTVQEPPNLLALYCKEQSGEGGETTLIDMKKVLYQIIEKFGLNNPLLEKNNAIFADQDNIHVGNIIEIQKDGSFFVRFRNDKFGYFNSELNKIMPEFYSIIAENTIQIKLNTGQGYVINNGRYLHGRNSFVGSREMWRILLNDNYMAIKGFTI